MSHDLDPMEERRRKVGLEEARELREEVWRWMDEGEASEPIRSILASLIENELREAVRDTIASPETRESLQRPIVAGLRELVREEIARELTTQAFRQRFNEQVATEAGRVVRTELKELRSRQPATRAPAPTADRFDIPVERREPPSARRPERLAEAEGDWMARESQADARSSDDSGEIPAGPVAPGSAHTKHWWHSLRSWLRPANLGWSALALAVLVALGFAVKLVHDKLIDTEAQVVENVEAEGKNSMTRTTSEIDGETAAPADESSFASRWRQIVRALPAGLQAAAGDDPLACWLPEHVVHRLDEIVAAAPGNDLGTSLRATFPQCTGDFSVAPGEPRLVIAAAQEAGRQFLAAENDRDYLGCAVPPSPPNLTGFGVDGLAGPTTWQLLDAVLACRGFAGSLTMSKDSDVSDYLFTLYLALDGLDEAA